MSKPHESPKSCRTDSVTDAREATDQQRALEQDLRIQQLEATVEALRNERAVQDERIRLLRAHTGLPGAARAPKYIRETASCSLS